MISIGGNVAQGRGVAAGILPPPSGRLGPSGKRSQGRINTDDQQAATADERRRIYARLGFDIPAEEIEEARAGVAAVEASIAELRELDVSGHEPQTVFTPGRYP